MLLQHGYSDKFNSDYHRVSSVFRALSSVFTRTIRSSALRFSMLAYIADTVPGNAIAQRKESFRISALRTLAENLLRPVEVEIADLFAAYLLCYRLSWNSSGAIPHYEGCIALHKFLSEKVASAPDPSPLFTVYGAFVLDELTVWLNTERSIQCNALQPIHLELPSFDDILEHFSPFTSTELPIIHCASWYTLQYCMDLIWLSIQHVVGRQARPSDNRDLRSEARLRAVKAQFYTHKLQQFLTVAEVTVEEALHENTAHHFHELIGILCACLCVQIGIRMLDDRDILQALQSNEVYQCTQKLATYLQTLGSNNHRVDMLCVLLGGLGLREGISGPRMDFPRPFADRLDSTWILKELESRDQGSLGRGLSSFWRAENYETLEQLVEPVYFIDGDGLQYENGS
jgi:hypothetical protein